LDDLYVLVKKDAISMPDNYIPILSFMDKGEYPREILLIIISKKQVWWNHQFILAISPPVIWQREEIGHSISI